MAGRTYSEKLKDPRWQRKRLEILQRDNWTCTLCGRDDVALHVHHGYYEFGLDPWEYDSRTLWTVCEDCHGLANDISRDVRFSIAKLPLEAQQYLILMASKLRTLDDENITQFVAEAADEADLSARVYSKLEGN